MRWLEASTLSMLLDLVAGPDELAYDVKWPHERDVSRIAERITAMDETGTTVVELEQHKAKS